YGGPEMAAAGAEVLFPLVELAVMWFLRVLLNLHKFLGLVGRADRYFRDERPDAVVLIDYPGLHWWIARKAKKRGIPVFYYVPPQIWAWAGWRVKKMRRFVDHVLCALRFEQQWLAARGCNAVFVGHPFFDEVTRQALDERFIRDHTDACRPLVALLPGSRTQEVVANLKYFIAAARQIQAQVPNARFAVASFKPHQAELARQAIANCGLPIDVFVRRTPELIHLAHCCLAVSGSVSLELLYHSKPTAILYWISPLAFAVQKRFRRVKYITLVNLLAAKEVFSKAKLPIAEVDNRDPDVLFPEYLTCEDKSAQLAEHAVEWLTNDKARQELIARLARLRAEVAHGGASSRAADYMMAQLARLAPAAPRPHFIPPLAPAHEPWVQSTAA
ncbi:MAG TPA: hypothetical protein VGJ16_00435, partial [Pirellulales bacterium]